MKVFKAPSTFQPFQLVIEFEEENEVQLFRSFLKRLKRGEPVASPGGIYDGILDKIMKELP